MCDDNKFMDSIEITSTPDIGITSIKFGCSELKDTPSSSSTRTFKYVKSITGESITGESTDTTTSYTAVGSFFCGIRALYGALDLATPSCGLGTDCVSRNRWHITKEFAGILGLDFLLCDAYDCRNKLSKTSNPVEDRVYKVVPGNTDFEQPAIETITVHNVAYGET